jgi:methylthioribose-1-phosphate isomerase
MNYQAVKWTGDIDGFLELIDQRLLPGEFVKLKCTKIEQVCDAIKTLAVRGAPAIGVTAAYGVALGMQKLAPFADRQAACENIEESCKRLAACRPTAVNLFWALNRVKKLAQRLTVSEASAGIESFRQVVLGMANRIYEEDVEMCRRIGQNGEKFITENSAVLTHCNAGALATAGQGTALSPMFEAHKKGKKFKVYADETRPLLQGGRLTAWELSQAGIDVTVICDNMAGWLMKQGKINAVITGADRIAANGDTANKIGTYSLSILAGYHNIPFYIAAPSSTFDLNIKTGDEIPIEQRPDDEIRLIDRKKITPDNIEVYNPAFDVTPVENITAVITETGIIEKPDAEKISRHLQGKSQAQ